jgi:HK97 family phage prohead protease
MADSNVSATERRFTAVPVELRAKAELRIGGYAAKFNKPSKNLGGFIEIVDLGAFNASRGDGWPDVIARYNHDDNMLLGTTGGGTLRLRVDDTGLDYEVDLPESRRDISELVQRGDVRKSSFAFRTIDDDWSMNDQGFPVRSLLKVQLVDVAPVNTPAYNDTTAAVRSLADKMGADIEEVRTLAAQDELRKFFVRTDKSGAPVPKKTTFGPGAMAALLAKKNDPWQ